MYKAIYKGEREQDHENFEVEIYNMKTRYCPNCGAKMEDINND